MQARLVSRDRMVALVLATTCWMLSCGIALADPPARVGRLSYVAGRVSLSPDADSDEWGDALLNYPVTSGNRLWSDADGYAEVRIGAIALRIGPRTGVGMTRVDDNGVEIYVSQGVASVSLIDTDGNEAVSVATPNAWTTLSGRGRYRVDVSAAGERTDVSVRRGGQAEVGVGAATFSLFEEQAATIQGAQQPAYDINAGPPPDGFEQWAYSRDRPAAPAQAMQYVSPQTTGYQDLDAYGSWQTTPDYGAVWMPSAVPADWAPYRFGHWAWVPPWGWTWIDDMPWGFAPFHYGRWAHLGGGWGWVPGRYEAHPVYAPALVAFVGGATLSVSLGLADHCGWVPLAPREPFVPWYTASPGYVRAVNVTHGAGGAHVAYANRSVPGAVTVVPNAVFAHGQPVNGRVARRLGAVAALPSAGWSSAPPAARPEPAGVPLPGVAHRPPPEAAARLYAGRSADGPHAALGSPADRPGVSAGHGREGPGPGRESGQRPVAPAAGGPPVANSDARRPEPSPAPRRVGPPQLPPAHPDAPEGPGGGRRFSFPQEPPARATGTAGGMPERRAAIPSGPGNGPADRETGGPRRDGPALPATPPRREERGEPPGRTDASQGIRGSPGGRIEPAAPVAPMPPAERRPVAPPAQVSPMQPMAPLPPAAPRHIEAPTDVRRPAAEAPHAPVDHRERGSGEPRGQPPGGDRGPTR